jgi:hypothetical protein
MPRLSERTIFRRMAEGLTREEAERSRKRKPGPKPRGSKRFYKTLSPQKNSQPLDALEVGNCSIRHCDLRDLEVEPGSVRLVLSDPPYDRASLPEWAALAKFSADALGPWWAPHSLYGHSLSARSAVGRHGARPLLLDTGHSLCGQFQTAHPRALGRQQVQDGGRVSQAPPFSSAADPRHTHWRGARKAPPSLAAGAF